VYRNLKFRHRRRLPSLCLDGTHVLLRWTNGFYRKDQDADLDLR